MEEDFAVSPVALLEYIKPENLSKQLKVYGLAGGDDQLGFASFLRFLSKTLQKLREQFKTESDNLDSLLNDAEGSPDKMKLLEVTLMRFKSRMRKYEKLKNELRRVEKEVLLLKVDTSSIFLEAKSIADKIRLRLERKDITPEGLNRLVARYNNFMASIQDNLVKLKSHRIKYSKDYLESMMDTLSTEYSINTTLLRFEAQMRKRKLVELIRNTEVLNNISKANDIASFSSIDISKDVAQFLSNHKRVCRDVDDDDDDDC
ncbi:unnamed protein product [Parnassius apollo]|uniref:(apollo) hypothetical protein n=1 Tax=Parnassius apollo TaxID=110799 RepID=A0A8S3XBL2_PARAO|nr:unnamed protein product [Parnassius apollo]